jgi:hypothetical protein
VVVSELSKLIGIVPASKSWAIWLVPLYGTWVSAMPAMDCSSYAARWVLVPMPEVP